MSPLEELHIDVGSSVPEMAGSKRFQKKRIRGKMRETLLEDIIQEGCKDDPKSGSQNRRGLNLLDMVAEYETGNKLSTGQNKHPRDGVLAEHEVEDHKRYDFKEKKLVEFAADNGFAINESVL
ncbi:hypothetical protein HHK36_008010 [Tetracentron sinense]|uniref:Uncharacterized protein n=1 Tax=Tetracentron sinense TaxID=13715 RepID=A0A835DMU3_TETSI|nr:hypothetical protein HHK36_008010 [Tetracentron sinense]